MQQTDPIGYDDGINWYLYRGNNPLMWIDPYGLCSVKYDYWSAFSGQGSAYVNDVIDYFADIFTAPGDYYERFNEAGLSTPVALVETVIFSGGKIFGYGLFMEGVVGIDVRSGTETHGWQRKTQLIFGGIGTGATAIAGANSLNAALPSSGPAAVSHWGSKGLETNSWVMKDKPSPSNYFRSGKWSRLGGIKLHHMEVVSHIRFLVRRSDIPVVGKH